MVGRDIGTVVLPEADLKIYLDASAEVRARRRYDENISLGKLADYDAILANVRERDRIDSTRAVAPLTAAEDAIRMDSELSRCRAGIPKGKGTLQMTGKYSVPFKNRLFRILRQTRLSIAVPIPFEYHHHRQGQHSAW